MAKSSSKETKEPKVVVFGSEVGEKETEEKTSENKFVFHHGSFTWGLLFIFVGIIFLLSNFGVLTSEVWPHIFRFWPVVIILIGVDTVLGHSDISEIVSTLFTIFIFLTILGVVFSIFAPQVVSGLPVPVLNYFQSIARLIQK